MHCLGLEYRCVATCDATIEACQNGNACAALMQEILLKCNITDSTGCNQECWTTFNASARLYPTILFVHVCDCSASGNCGRVLNAVTTCVKSVKALTSQTTQGPQTRASQAPRTQVTMSGARTPGPTSTATQRSLAFGAIAIGVVAGVLFV